MRLYLATILCLFLSQNSFATPSGDSVKFPFNSFMKIYEDHTDTNLFWQTAHHMEVCIDASKEPEFKMQSVLVRDLLSGVENYAVDIKINLCPVYLDNKAELKHLQQGNPDAFIKPLPVDALSLGVRGWPNDIKLTCISKNNKTQCRSFVADQNLYGTIKEIFKIKREIRTSPGFHIFQKYNAENILITFKSSFNASVWIKESDYPDLFDIDF